MCYRPTRMAANNVYRDGYVFVCEQMCSTCIFRKGNLMHLQPGRVREMVNEARRNDGTIVCHKTLGHDNAACYGFFARYKPFPLRLAIAMRRIWFVRTR